MAEWDVVSQAPAPVAAPPGDPWKVVDQTPQPAPAAADSPWQVVNQTAAPAPAPATETFNPKNVAEALRAPFDKPSYHGLDALRGIGQLGADLIHSIMTIPERAVKGSQQDVQTMGSGEPMESVGPATEAAMTIMPFKRTVGGVRAHPTEAAAEAPKPVEPVAPPTETAKPVETPKVVEAPPTEPVTPPVEVPPEQLKGAKAAARVIQNILDPAEVSEAARTAAADIRAAGGKAARDTATTQAALDAEARKINSLTDAEKLEFIDYVENRSKGDRTLRPDVQPAADALRDAAEMRRTKIEELPSVDKLDFIDDYFPHMWKDPNKAADFVREYTAGTMRQGSGASLKKRTIPTVADGLAAGLEPVSVNPLETMMRYVTSMDRFIATQQVLDKAKADGNIVYIRPRVMGASGHPESFQAPPGWVPINGRGSVNGAGARAYAPADFARVYNNFIDAGIHGWSADLGKVYDTVRRASNSVTALELGLSGFHAATMAQEAMVNGVARAIEQLVAGKPISAVKALVKAPVTPVANTLKGRKLEAVYLRKAKGDPLMEQITDLLTEAGGRAKGMKHAPEYEYTTGKSYWDSFKYGTAQMEAKALGREFREAPLKTAAIYPFRQVGRILQTVAKPLFEYTIPKMKTGAFYDNMASWLEANPLATKPEQLKAARKIWNSIDNRFGETVQDNIFWDKTLKQSLQVALRSYSWTFGTIQEIGGGMKALARHPTSLSPKSKHYSPKSAYVIALPIVYATLNAVYQKLKTGKDPESIEDVMRGGMSGGTQPGVGGRGTVKERIMMPGYMKDVFGWYAHPVQEAQNKMATAPRMVLETLTNKDWKNQPIRNPSAPTPEQVRQYFQYVYRSLGPISMKQLMQGNKKGSNLTSGETLLGLRPVPGFLQDPEGYKKMKEGINRRDWDKKRRFDIRQEKQYGGPQ